MWSLVCGLLFFVKLVHCTVLMEVGFDLALQQESETGYTASHTVGEYLKDPNLLWLRYLNTLVSGQSGNAPMRTALLEFKDYKNWAAFEQTNLERTHVLYDLFWINWRRVLWEEDEEEGYVHGNERTEERPGGYIFFFRYTAKEAKSSRALQQQLGTVAKALSQTPTFIEKRSWRNGLWQDSYSNFVWFEFHDLNALTKAVYEGDIARILDEFKDKLSKFATSVMVPAAGAQGGQIFKGERA
eukprot:TRINITY_DN1769_c0_g1_i1.p1 TRINITY_DN1769_c0_g1~~TRINITY_DN1769_c0_g1_i1.p1  ORF type:complete len:242 (-),score=40.37 TRINITY_DN1769_c0_g1_i1:22-747(-)